MSKEKVTPPEVAEYYQIYLDKWLPDGWTSKLQYINDEFQDGWSFDVFLPGSEREPQIPNVPVDGTVPHFMVNKCIHSYQKGMHAGHCYASEQFVIGAMTKAAADCIKIVTSLPGVAEVSRHVHKLSDYRGVRGILDKIKDEN